MNPGMYRRGMCASPSQEKSRHRAPNPPLGVAPVERVRSHAWLIVAVLAATVLGFGAASVYSTHVASTLDEDAVSIATDASPAIEHLSAARGAILQIQLDASSAVGRPAGDATTHRASFDASLSRLHRELSAYLALPFYPGERDYYEEVNDATRSLETRVASFSSPASARETPRARCHPSGRASPRLVRGSIRPSSVSSRSTPAKSDVSAPESRRFGPGPIASAPSSKEPRRSSV